MTSVIQMLDTEFIAVYRNNEKKITERWASANLHVKVNIAKRLIPNTFFTAEALQATFTVVDVPAVFTKLGYPWDRPNGSHISIRGLPTYKFNPEAACLLFLRYFEDAEKRAEAHRQMVAAVARPMKQHTIASMFHNHSSSSSSSSNSSSSNSNNRDQGSFSVFNAPR